MTTPKLPVSRFSTAQLDAASRWDAWRDSIAVLFDVSPQAGPLVREAPQSVLAAHLGTVLFGEIEFAAQSYARTQQRVIRDGLDHYLVQFYAEGGFAGTAGAAEVRLQAGDICILDLAQTVQTHNPSSHVYNLVIPRAMLDGLIPNAAALHGTILRQASPAGRLLGAHLRSLARCLPDMQAADAPMLAEAAVGMVAACFRPSASLCAQAAAPLSSATLGLLRRHIETRLHTDLSPAGLCAAFRLSRTTLYRLFEPLGGVSAYVQERRLARAHAALRAPANQGRRIHEVAFDCGFTSEAHFSRSFRRAFGIAPSLLQKQAGTVPPDGTAEYARWIARLRTG